VVSLLPALHNQTLLPVTDSRVILRVKSLEPDYFAGMALPSDQSRGIVIQPVPTRAELDELLAPIDKVVATLKGAFPTASAEFNQKYGAWRESCRKPHVMLSSRYATKKKRPKQFEHSV